MQMYKLLEGEYYSEDLGTYTSYGIVCEEEEVSIPDITPSKGSMVKFIETINKLELSIIHIQEAVQDFLGVEYGY